MQNLWNIRDELHVAEDVIFVGEKVLIPAKLRQGRGELVDSHENGCHTNERVQMTSENNTHRSHGLLINEYIPTHRGGLKLFVF